MLEQNYRSTASILKTSLAIVSQDKKRIPKSLHTSHPSGATPFLRSFESEHAESLFIAIEIKKLIAHMGGALSWGDVAILLRFNALSRVIESTLQKHGIPSRVLGGHKFFERQEVKNILAYLQLVDNPDFSPALVRASNVPSRGIGEKTLQEIAARAEASKVSQLTIMERICDCRLPDMKPPAKRKLSSFVSAIRTLRDLANKSCSAWHEIHTRSKGTPPADLIRRLVDLIGFEDHLKKTQPDWESRWENVKELITFATEVAANVALVEEQAGPSDAPKETPLRSFLQASMLSSEGDNQSEEENQKVTISTCHAAKGLEWPVVMVPSGICFVLSPPSPAERRLLVEDGTLPFSRSEDKEEERRLLYVACTRAQGLLYLTHAESRSIAGNKKGRVVSPFISAVKWDNPTMFTDLQPTFLPADRKVICDVLNRPLPDEEEITRRIAEFERTTPHHLRNGFSESPPEPQFNAPAAGPVDLTATFTTSSAVLRNTARALASSSKPPFQRQSHPPTNPSHLLAEQYGHITQPVQNSMPLGNRTVPSSSTPFGHLTRDHHPSTSGASSSPPSFQSSSSSPASWTTERPSSVASNAATPVLRAPNTLTALYSAPGPSRSVAQQPTSQPNSSPRTEFTLPATLQMHPLLRKKDAPSFPRQDENTPSRPIPAPTVAPVAKPGAGVGTPTNIALQGTKRRLGMGRCGGGYSNKKFKPPT
ncbi:hypothetical protein DXG01_002221 [Tephrocybe rancida]|nr:hypothetical protein DXG01_002221 [Tephrocybe rancida]